MWLIMIVAIVITVVQIVKEHRTKEIPSDYWGTGKGLQEDIINGVPHEIRMKRLHDGYYKNK